jgi:hypothetical protein
MKKLNQTSLRKLPIGRETLRRLSSTELAHVAGGLSLFCNPTTICTHPCNTQ